MSEQINDGGGGGIRTHGRVAPTAVFKTAALNRSATPPNSKTSKETNERFNKLNFANLKLLSLLAARPLLSKFKVCRPFSQAYILTLKGSY